MQELSFGLIQCRYDDDPMLKHEIECFALALSLPVSNFTTVNLPYDRLSYDLLEKSDVLLVGGAGSFGVTEHQPFLPAFFDFIAGVCDIGFPMFASCFGFQALCMALGGQVESRPSCVEVGTFDLELTPEGREDQVFGTLPDIFPAQLGHKDSATGLPDGVINLARSKRVAYQALRLPGLPIYATQFHPELTKPQNLDRFETYQRVYREQESGVDFQQVIDSLRETRETYSLLPKFITEIVAPQIVNGSEANNNEVSVLARNGRMTPACAKEHGSLQDKECQRSE